MNVIRGTFAEHAIDGKRTGFSVVPGRYIPHNLTFGLIAGFAVVVLLLFPYSRLLGLMIAAGGGWWIYKNAGRWLSKVHEHKPGGQFVASAEGIELDNGTQLHRDDIINLSVVNFDQHKISGPVAYMLQVDAQSAGGHPIWLAGGMDVDTAHSLHSAVKRALGFEAVNASSLQATSAGMQTGDLLLTEVAPDVYEVQRKTATGHELAAKAPAGEEEALAFAQQFAGDTPLWYEKLADRGAPPIPVPKT